MVWHISVLHWGFPGGSVGKNPPANAGDAGDEGSIRGSGRSPGGGNGNPLQYSCLENPTDRGAWWAAVHGVAKSWTWLRTHTQTHMCDWITLLYSRNQHNIVNQLYFNKINFLKSTCNRQSTGFQTAWQFLTNQEKDLSTHKKMDKRLKQDLNKRGNQNCSPHQ